MGGGGGGGELLHCLDYLIVQRRCLLQHYSYLLHFWTHNGISAGQSSALGWQLEVGKCCQGL